MKGLTRSQEGVLEFIARAIEDGMPPTLRDISLSVGSTHTNAAATYVEALTRKGMVTRRSKLARGLALTERGRAYVQQLRERRPHA